MKKMFLSLMVAMLFGIVAFGQVKEVTGKVTDAGGVALANASVKEKGTKNGVASTVDGSFKISVKQGAVLVISVIGFEPKEVLASGNLNISLATDTKTLNEVVVTALGIRKQAKELGYSAATVSGKDLETAVPISVANGLTGKVAGLGINTTNNGVFAPTRIVLRGNRSLTGNNQALIVVDGAIYYNDISTINPDDIVDINILKGASASAIYGSDASNGVMLITTKKGVKGRSSITFSSTAQIEAVSYMPALQNEFGSNGGEAFVNDFSDLTTYVPYENQSYGPRYNGRMVPLGRVLSDGTVQMVPYTALPNEKRNFFADGFTTQNNISFQSGDEHSSSYISLQDVNTKAVMPGDIGRRDALRVGGTKTYGIFSATYSIGYTYKYKNNTNTGSVYDNVMNSPAHVPLTSYKDWRNNKYATLDGYYNDYFDNPYWDIDNQRNKSTEHNVSANMQLSIKPVDWLTLSYRGAITEIIGLYEYTGAPHTYSNFSKTDKRVVYANNNGGYDTVLESAKYIANSAGANGSPATYRNGSGNNLLFSSDFLASFSKDITKDFSLKVNAGISYLDNKKSYNSVGATALLIPVYNVANVSGTPSAGNGNAEARKFGYFADVTVGYNNYLFVHGSYRTDIDSRLSRDNRYIPYYDVDASFVITDAFPKLTNDVFSFAKLRGAYSITGNVSGLGGGSNFIADAAYVINPAYYANATGFTTGQYVQSTTVSNPNIHPEKVNEKEIGLELGFFKNRIYLTASAYRQETTDGIVTASTASSSGFYKALLNAANTVNKGIELELKANIVRTKNVSWNVGLNYTYNENKVTSINGDLLSLQLSPTIGDISNAVITTGNGTNGNAYAVKGSPFPLIQTRDWVRDPASGKVIVDPNTGNPSASTALSPFGRATPKDIFGFTTNVTWKSFTFTLTGDYRGGYNIFNAIGQYMDFTGISATSASTHRQRFVFPNSVYSSNGKYVDNTNIMVDDANFNFWPGLYRSVGGNYITSAAALKIREVAIAYQFPQSLLGHLKIVKNATFTLSGRNLLMIRPKSNLWTDPEFNEGTGNDAGRTTENQTPPTRFYSATLSITL